MPRMKDRINSSRASFASRRVPRKPLKYPRLQDTVHSQLGEPVKVASYLFAPGKTWFYYVKGGIPGNEKLVEIQFDDQGLAQSSKLVDANFYGLNRWD